MSRATLDCVQDEDQDYHGSLLKYMKEEFGIEDYDYMKPMEELLREDPDGFRVLCHGDAWFNNIMFK